jgi:hypothetical protein
MDTDMVGRGLRSAPSQDDSPADARTNARRGTESPPYLKENEYGDR